MEFLFAWYNIVFLIPLVVGVIFLLGSAAGFIGHGDVDHDLHLAEADHDVTGDAGHDAGDHDAGDHDTEHDSSHGAHVMLHEAHDDRTIVSRALAAFGIGRVPLSIIATTAALLFGGIGMAANFILAPVFVTGWIYGWMSLAIAAIAMVSGTGTIARIVARVMPTSETYRVRKRDFVGCQGTLLFPLVGSGSSYAQLHDAEGNLQQVTVRSRDGSTVPKGAEVTVSAYVRDEDVFLVTAAEGRRAAG